MVVVLKKDILNLVYLSNYYGLNEVGEYWHQVLKLMIFSKIGLQTKLLIILKGENLSKIKKLQFLDGLLNLIRMIVEKVQL